MKIAPLIFGAGLAGNIAALAIVVAQPASPATYSLVRTATDGNVYVDDTGLTADDCRAALKPGSVCEPEAMVRGTGCDGATGPIWAREESDLPRCDRIEREY